MERIYKYFSFFVVMILAAFTLFMLAAYELPGMSQMMFAEELTGALSEGEDTAISEVRYYASGVNDSYSKLRSWGIKRGVNGELPKADPGAPELLSKYNSLYLADTNKKTIYLTFDEGYENGYTPMILDTLKEKQVPAAFFITGPYLQKQEELVKRMLDEGHIVGNHTQNHPSPARQTALGA